MQSNVAESRDSQLLYTIEEVAYILSTSGTSVRRWIKNGSLNTVRPSIGTVRVTRAELERFVNEAPGTSYQTSRDCPPCGGRV